MENATIQINGPAVIESQRVSIVIEIEANVLISAKDAQCNANAWLLDHVGHLAMADHPILLLGTRSAWRVPVLLSSPRHPPQGPIGTVEIDVETGEVLASPETAEKLIRDGRALSRSVSSSRE